MKMRIRRRPRLTPLLLVSTLPAAGLTLLTLGIAAGAQETPPGQDAAANKTAAALRALIQQGNSGGQARPQPASGTFKIGEFVVIGNKSLSKDYIIIASGHKIGESCSAETLADIQAKLFSTGLFGINTANPEEDAVKVSAEDNPATGLCKVIIEVAENPTIQNINLTGTGPIKPEVVLPLLSNFKPNVSVYNENQFRRDAVAIQDLYQSKGYLVTVGQDAGIDDRGVLNLPLQVTRVKEIKIVGAHKTRRFVILREMNTKIGDYYNTNTFQKDILRLLNLDIFEDVRPSDYPIGPGQIGLTLNILEKRTGTVTAGVGYSNRAQLIGFAEIADTDFRGQGEGVNLRGEVGGVAGRPSIELGFNEPYLDHHRTALNVQLYDKTEYRFANSLTSGLVGSTNVGSSNRYNDQRVGGTVTVSRPFLTNYRAALTARVENVRTNSLVLPIETSPIIQDGPIYVLGTSLIHNTRDLDLDPVSGGYQTLQFNVGHASLKAPIIPGGTQLPSIIGDVTFFKANLEMRQYFSLAGKRKKPTENKTSLALRGIVGTSTGTLPFFEQFFVGGGDNLRGYLEDRFWGSNLLLGSVELRQPLAPKFKGVLFFDAGDAWGGSYRDINLSGFSQGNFQIHVGVGLGIRVITPIGPLRLDYGFGDHGGQAYFNIGPTF